MIFSPDLAAKITLGQKTVTRRPVKRDAGGHALRCTYEPGRTYAVQLCRGGTAVERIKILGVRREELVFPITWTEAAAEGFRRPSDFAAKWRSLYGPFETAPRDVWRIEFALVT